MNIKEQLEIQAMYEAQGNGLQTETQAAPKAEIEAKPVRRGRPRKAD